MINFAIMLLAKYDIIYSWMDGPTTLSCIIAGKNIKLKRLIVFFLNVMYFIRFHCFGKLSDVREAQSKGLNKKVLFALTVRSIKNFPFPF